MPASTSTTIDDDDDDEADEVEEVKPPKDRKECKYRHSDHRESHRAKDRCEKKASSGRGSWHDRILSGVTRRGRS
jgi:hypothetical protein